VLSRPALGTLLGGGEKDLAEINRSGKKGYQKEGEERLHMRNTLERLEKGRNPPYAGAGSCPGHSGKGCGRDFKKLVS